MALTWVLAFGLLALASNAAANDATTIGEVCVVASVSSTDPSSVNCSLAGNGAADFWQEGVTYSRSSTLSAEGKVLVTQYQGDEVNCCVVDEAVLQIEGVDPCKTTYECPEDFTMFGEHCYSFPPDHHYWQGAQEACKELNADAHLVRPYTKEIDDYVLSYVTKSIYSFWNDINCLETSETTRQFKFSNGEDLTYTNWADRQPDAGGNNCVENCNEDCGMYWRQPGQQHRWNDAVCDRGRNRYVCQMDRIPIYSYYED